MSLLAAAWYTLSMSQIKSRHPKRSHFKVCEYYAMWKTRLVSNRFLDIRQNMFTDAKDQLKTAYILRGDRYHKDGAVIIRELLKKGCIPEDTYRDLIDVRTGEELLGTNVFAFHVNSGEISFQSTLIKQFCEENAAYWEVNE